VRLNHSVEDFRNRQMRLRALESTNVDGARHRVMPATKWRNVYGSRSFHDTFGNRSLTFFTVLLRIAFKSSS
jgi:hypothetical protein